MQTIIAKISILMNDQIIHIPILNEFWLYRIWQEIVDHLMLLFLKQIITRTGHFSVLWFVHEHRILKIISILQFH